MTSGNLPFTEITIYSGTHPIQPLLSIVVGVLKLRMSSCFGCRKKSRSGDREPLLPKYNDVTTLQRRLHQKLHTYQMVKALCEGYMPSTEQAIVNLGTLLASDVLNTETTGLTGSGRMLLKYAKQWVAEFIELLRNKNNGDQIQDFIWFLSHARMLVDPREIFQTASAARAKANAAAVIWDGGSTMREVFAHTANETEDQKDTLLFKLKAAATKLRKRNYYSDSVSIIGLLIKRYANVYSSAADKTISTVQQEVETSEELDRAVKNGWSLLSSFGDKNAWQKLEQELQKVKEHSKKDPEFEARMEDLVASIQKMLTDPDFFKSVGNKVVEVKGKSEELIGSESPLRQDIEKFLQQARVTFHSVLNDQDVTKLLSTSLKIWNIISPGNAASKSELFTDMYNVFFPLLIQAIQFIPIPRLEISAPEIDLLLENLILEPGRTINNSSFLPFQLNIETYNNLIIRKARKRTKSTLTTLVTINIQGISMRADEVGFWLRAHKGLLRLADEGIASFELDDRGFDIALDVEIGQDRLEKILSLSKVRVKIHHLRYTLRKSRFACLAWVFKRLLRPIIRRVLERQLSTTISDALHAANRELLYARERLRATRISDPKDMKTFIKAIITRLTPEEDPDVYASVGLTASSNVRGSIFAGVYTPGSVVKLWNEEAAQVAEKVYDHSTQGWRNEMFDVQAA